MESGYKKMAEIEMIAVGKSDGERKLLGNCVHTSAAVMTCTLVVNKLSDFLIPY